MSIGVSRGYEPGRQLLQLPTDELGSKHAGLAEDEKLPLELRDASRLLSEAEHLLSAEENPEQAQRTAKEALALFNKHSDSQGISDTTRVLMCALGWWEEREEAVKLGEQHLKVVVAEGNKEQEGVVLQSLAEVATFRMRLEMRNKAAKWADEAVAVYQELENKKLEGYAHLAAASIHTQKGVKAHQRKHYMRAIKELKAALALFADCDDGDITARGGEARALHGLAAAHGRMEDFRKSVAYSREAAAVWQGLGLRKQEGLELEFLARLQMQLGNLKEGRKSAEEALKIFITIKKASTWQGVALRTTVKALVRGRKIKEARKLVTRRMHFFKEAKDLVGMAATKDALAEVVMSEGDCDGAAKLLGEALDIGRDCRMKERQLKKFEATMVAEQANLYLQGQKYEDALEFALTSHGMFEKINCEVEMATTLSTIVMAHLCMEQPDKAIEATNKAIGLYQRLNDAKGEGLAWINHCSALTKIGDMEEAAKTAMKARDIFASQKLLIGEGQALDHLSSLHMTKGDFAKSATCAKRGRQLFREASCVRQEAFMAWAEAEALFGQAQLQVPDDHKPDDEIPECYKKALELGEEGLKLSRQSEDEILIMHSQQVIAKTLIMSYRHWAAVEAVEEALALSRKLNQSPEEANLLLLQAQIHLCEKQDQDAIEVAKRARDIFEEIGNEHGMEEARKLIDGDLFKQKEEYGVDSAAPMPMMPSEMAAYGVGGIGGRKGGPGPMMAPGAPPPAAAPGAASVGVAAPAPVGGPTEAQIMEQVTDIAQSLIGSDDLVSDTPLMDAGLDSLASVEFQNMLTKEFRGVAMPSTMMFDFPTAKEIAGFIKENYRG